MQKSKITLLSIAAISASLILSAIAVTSQTYTWEKTFDVTKPQVVAKIEISKPRIIGCPVNIWIMLRLNCDCKYEDNDYCWKEGDEWQTKCVPLPCSNCSITGIYEAHLYWYNITSENWQHLMHLQEPINMTITCQKHIETYTFTPMLEGQYKVVALFTVGSEVTTFQAEG